MIVTTAEDDRDEPAPVLVTCTTSAYELCVL